MKRFFLDGDFCPVLSRCFFLLETFSLAHFHGGNQKLKLFFYLRRAGSGKLFLLLNFNQHYVRGFAFSRCLY